jgi:putative YphP/YqiW family bacilliredoxin
MYPPQIVMPMKEELTTAGFKDVTSATEVENLIKNTKGTVLMVVNSVCGCAAGNARPGAKKAVQYSKKPDVLATVFAGFDIEAVAKAREFFVPFPPSSPSMALFKDGKLVHFIERHQIEGASSDMVASNLMGAFEKYC